MIDFVNAKINLGLNVVERRSDGYHNLETIFYPVGKHSGKPGHLSILCDILEIVEATDNSDELIIMGREVDCPTEKNLVWKALQAFRKSYQDNLPPLKIILYKHLPDGAGMGGGSADASFTLRLLNNLTGETMSDDMLKNLALSLGADCPFFIYNRPCYATGIGEQLEPIDIDLSGKWIAIVKPSVSISTKEAFLHITPKAPKINLRDLVKRPIEEWKNLIVNDFEQSMFTLHPEIRAIKDNLYNSGAIYASMTGSGSAFYGIYNSYDKAKIGIEKSGCEFATVTEA